MSNTYKIDLHQNLIFVKYAGPVSVKQKIAFDDAILADPKFKRINALCDLTDSEFNWSLEDIDKFRNYVRRIRDHIKDTKWAVLTSGGTTEHTAKIFSVLQSAYDNIVSVKVFMDREKALKWLKEKD